MSEREIDRKKERDIERAGETERETEIDLRISVHYYKGLWNASPLWFYPDPDL